MTAETHEIPLPGRVIGSKSVCVTCPLSLLRGEPQNASKLRRFPDRSQRRARHPRSGVGADLRIVALGRRLRSPIAKEMSEQAAAALPLPEPSTSEREALLEAGRLTGLGELVRGFAHEVNNPLFGMLGLVELLLREIEPGTKAHERLSLVQQSGLEIKRITHSLLGFTQGDSGEIEVVSLQDVAAKAVELVRCTSAGKSVELRENYPERALARSRKLAPPRPGLSQPARQRSAGPAGRRHRHRAARA